LLVHRTFLSPTQSLALGAEAELHAKLFRNASGPAEFVAVAMLVSAA
jgi:hypothetical protein